MKYDINSIFSEADEKIWSKYRPIIVDKRAMPRTTIVRDFIDFFPAIELDLFYLCIDGSLSVPVVVLG